MAWGISWQCVRLVPFCMPHETVHDTSYSTLWLVMPVLHDWLPTGVAGGFGSCRRCVTCVLGWSALFRYRKMKDQHSVPPCHNFLLYFFPDIEVPQEIQGLEIMPCHQCGGGGGVASVYLHPSTPEHKLACRFVGLGSAFARACACVRVHGCISVPNYSLPS